MAESEIEKLLRDYLDYLEIEKNRSPKTRENYEHYLNEFLKFSEAHTAKDITDGIVREFRMALARRDMKRLTQSYYVIEIGRAHVSTPVTRSSRMPSSP